MKADSLHILGSRQFGGADKFYVRLIAALNQAGHRAVPVNRTGSPVAKALAERDIPSLHLPLANKWDLYSTLRIRALVRKLAPRIVQTYMGRATRLTRLPRDGLASHVARLGGYYKVPGYYEHPDAWVGNTRGICLYLEEQGLPTAGIHHIGNFVDPALPVSGELLSELRRRHRLPENAWVIYTLGRFIHKKGFADLLNAFARLPREVEARTLVLMISGDGPLRDDLHRLGRELGLGARLIWTGWQNDAAPFYALADAMVCPSRHEPLGNVILEAWSHRLPVVSTTTDGARELVRDGENGLLSACPETECLAGRISELLAMETGARKAMAENGYRYLMENYSREAVVNAYLGLYETLRDRRLQRSAGSTLAGRR